MKCLNENHNPCINCNFFARKKKEINKFIDNKLIEKRETPSCRVKWNSISNDLDINWNLVNGSVFKCTQDTYTQWFLTRMVHRILRTIRYLSK